MKSILKYILLTLLFIFIILQFFGVDKSVPEFNTNTDFLATHNPSSDVESIFRSACYDCHSYETTYPWYSNIQPVAWWLQDHIDEGRDEMNLSLWNEYSTEDADHLLEEMVEMVEEEEMPLPSYTWTHSDARLTDQQRENLTNWAANLRTSLQQKSDSTAATGSTN
ncbi:MAG: heme-binding domain-containing protein [Balneolaceae bacterium]|nr:heme-binding domain-containing protein [Balneolaceae bacterium]